MANILDKRATVPYIHLMHRGRAMTPQEFRDIRLGLMLTQADLAIVLGYSHRIRVTELECGTSKIPRHIADAMAYMARHGLLPVEQWGDPVRGWTLRFLAA